MKKTERKYVPIWVFILITIVVFCWGLCWGRYSVPLGEMFKIIISKFSSIPVTWTKNAENTILRIRLPRLLAAFLVGGALSVSGVTYQGIFQNPLVSPDLLGVSAGACVGASIAILSGMNGFGIQIPALIGGLLAVAITNYIPRLFHNRSNLTLVLSGIIVSGFFSSMQGVMKYIADPDTQLQQITFWTMGSLAKVKLSDVAFIAPAMIIAMLVLFALRWQVNLLSLGEREAQGLGVNIRLMRGVMILCSTVLTACSICVAGTIGWIGLVMPHLGRLLVGADNRKLIPASIFLGAAFLIVVDSIARNISGLEIPLSILTGFLGAPLYTWLLVRQRTKI